MDLKNEKCVFILDETLPAGVAANTAGILGITLGKHLPEAVGPDVVDRDGRRHLGIIQLPVPVLKASQEKIRELRERLCQPDFSDFTVVDFSDVAQGCNVYEEFVEKAENTPEKDFVYFGIGICGAKKRVSQFTGNLPLFR